MDYITKCAVPDCKMYVYCKGWCQKHYHRWYTHGDPLIVEKVVGENRTKHELYSTYRSMLERCYRKTNKAYSYYGGRGISVCERWRGPQGFTNFVADMGKRPTGFSIDRTDNDKGYSPENCRWVNKSVQQANQRVSKVNTSGYKGVHWFKKARLWQVYIDAFGKRKSLGYYKTLEEAVKVRKAAEEARDLTKRKVKDIYVK